MFQYDVFSAVYYETFPYSIVFFHKAAFADSEIDVESITFHELRDMAINANKMLLDKVEAQKRLKDPPRSSRGGSGQQNQNSKREE